MTSHSSIGCGGQLTTTTAFPWAYCFGTREHKNLDELCRLLAPFNIKTVYADNNYAYNHIFMKAMFVTGKRKYTAH